MFLFSVSSGGKTEKVASNTFQAYQASVSDAWDIEVRKDVDKWKEVFSKNEQYGGWVVSLNINVKVILAFDSFANDQI